MRDQGQQAIPVPVESDSSSDVSLLSIIDSSDDSDMEENDDANTFSDSEMTLYSGDDDDIYIFT